MAIIDPFPGNCSGHYGHLHGFSETLRTWQSGYVRLSHAAAPIPTNRRACCGSFLIPALACLGDAVGGYLKFRDQRRQEQIPAPQYTPPTHQTNPPLPEISTPTTSELIPPTSITEDTTKRLKASR